MVNLEGAFLLLSSSGLYTLATVGGALSGVTTNLVPEQIVAYNGGVYGLYQGQVYSGALVGSTITWTLVSSLPSGVIYLNTTTDPNNSYLWLQTPTQGFLYDSSLALQSGFPIPYVNRTRVYGTSPTVYAESSILNTVVEVTSGDTVTSYYNVAGFAFAGDTFTFFTRCQINYYSSLQSLTIDGVPSVVWISAYQCL